MSEVKTYWVDLGGASFTGQMFGCNDEVVKVADFDAQRLRADTAEDELALTEERRQTIASAYMQLLGAMGDKDMSHSDALSRASEITEILNGWLGLFPKQGITGGPITAMKDRTRAALNQKSEGESHE